MRDWSSDVCSSDLKAELTISEPFDRAWRRVGIALDSAGFSVDDRDRSAGDYFIRYLDTDTGEKIEQQSFFGRLFGTENKAEATQYRLHVAQQGTSSTVTVLDKDGKQDTSGTAKRIITALSHHMGASPASQIDRKSTRLNSSHPCAPRLPSPA